MKITDWSHDPNARMVYREIEDAIRPVLARLMPRMNVTQVGIRMMHAEWEEFDPTRHEVRLVVHLRQDGKRMPPEEHFQPRITR